MRAPPRAIARLDACLRHGQRNAASVAKTLNALPGARLVDEALAAPGEGPGVAAHQTLLKAIRQMRCLQSCLRLAEMCAEDLQPATQP